MYLSLRPPSRSPGSQGINIDLDTMVKPWYDRREKECHGMTEERKNAVIWQKREKMPRYNRKERGFTGASMTGHDIAGAAGLWISDVLRPAGHGLENDRFREGRRRDREKREIASKTRILRSRKPWTKITKTNHLPNFYIKNIYLNIR